MLKSLFLSHRALLNHNPPAHPESPLRLESILRMIEVSPYRGELNLLIERLATPEELLLNHAPSYVEKIFSLEGQDAQVDAETLLSMGSVHAARLAVGLGLEVTEQVITGKAKNGFAIVRPPGHHATPQNGLGFCIFNNIAVAAKKALSLGIQRILILDWDVHHGNGTQESFYADDRVFFIDLHQENLFPSSSGLLTEIGKDRGLGYTVNVPLPHSCQDSDYLAVFRSLVKPLAMKYRPELILVSAGFDAHVSDPLASMSLSTQGFELLARNGVHLANDLTDGKIVFFLEGGYDPAHLAKNVLSCIAALSEETEPSEKELSSLETPHFTEINSLIRKIYEIHPRNFTR